MHKRHADTVDTRELRFVAALSSAVLLLALALGPQAGLIVLAIQTLAFAFAAILGPRTQPYSAIFRAAVAPRLTSAPTVVAASPRQLGQAIAMMLSVIALLAGTVGLAGIFYALTAVVLVATLAQAVFNICVGCLLHRRMAAAVSPPPTVMDLTDDSARSTRDVTIS